MSVSEKHDAPDPALIELKAPLRGATINILICRALRIDEMRLLLMLSFQTYVAPSSLNHLSCSTYPSIQVRPIDLAKCNQRKTDHSTKNCSVLRTGCSSAVVMLSMSGSQL